MFTCVMIMHKMMIEDEGLNNLKYFEHEAITHMCKILSFNSYMKFIKELENQNIHFCFKVIRYKTCEHSKAQIVIEIKHDSSVFNFNLFWILKFSF